MNCRKFQKHFVDLLDPLNEDPRTRELKEHLGSCPVCAEFFGQIKRVLAALEPSTQVNESTDFKEKVMKKVIEMDMEESRPWSLGRLFRRPLLATALLVVVVGAFVLNNYYHSGQAYGMEVEKILNASKSVRFIHMKFEPATYGHINEMWAQFDEGGKLLHLRFTLPDTEDGPKDVSWAADKVEVWFKKKNSVAVVREKNILDKTKMTIRDFDPKVIMEDLYKKQNDGKVKIEFEPSAAPPFKMNVSGTSPADWRDVYTVDLGSNLVQQVDKYQLKGGNFAFVGRTFYLDYNTTIGPEVFTLKPPADATRMDQVAQDIGLPKGSLSDHDIAVKVAHDFFEALVAENYALAGQLMEGIPGPTLQKMLAEKKIKFTRIISIGEPVASPQNGPGAVHIPCVVELQAEGQTGNQNFNLGVRPVYNQPDRWDVFGGF